MSIVDLTNIFSPSQALLDLLSNTSTITHLVINLCATSSCILEHLTWRSGHPMVLPNLARLNVQTFEVKEVLDMAETRFPGPTIESRFSPILEEVNIFYEDNENHEESRLDALRASGLSIQVLVMKSMPLLAFF
ncbi:hypothetical protein C8J56DRAFT_1056316 [Mycena floridula]|nr:hypothetical protein C8J56DRAFT_1056316 [Mycena floridula]